MDLPCAYHPQIDRMGQQDPAVEDEVKYRYNSVILHYRKSFIQENAQRYICLMFVFFFLPFQSLYPRLTTVQ